MRRTFQNEFASLSLTGWADDRLYARPYLTQAAFEYAPMDFIRIDAPRHDGRGSDAMMGTGHQLVPPQPPALIVVPDNVGGDTASATPLAIGPTGVISTTNTIGDLDFYQVTLVAGQTYEIGMYAKDGGPNGVPHGDAYIEVYDANGELIVSADGGASTIRNNLNSGFDVLLVYTPSEGGIYYVNARAFDQDPTNGTDGDFVGDYELFVRHPEGNYRPYYDVDSPLYAIDWGSQVDRTSRNPDGQEGPRPTENEFTGVGWNPYGITGKNVITYYFARENEVFVSNNPAGDPLSTALETTVASGFRDWEKAAFQTALAGYEKVADVVYVEVGDRTDADFVFITYNGTPDAGVLGRMSPPNESSEGQAEFNRNGPGWDEASLVEGGFSFITLVHELGHGHGLAHPHDNGGRSGIMDGVEPETGPGGTPEPFNYTHGDYSLNQGIYTMMSYESGWEESPYGQASTQAPYGWDSGPMAFDIAVLQDKYGVNEEWATGNDIYVLQDVNAQGTFYDAIWDADGIDSIVYSGARVTNIDLRAATLQYEVGGGGFLSYAFGIHGGFTIANGVTIENAYSGSGTDVLIGNDAANHLDAGAGVDQMHGGGGDDVMMVDNANDLIRESVGDGRDIVYARSHYNLNEGAEVEILSTVSLGSTIQIHLRGNEFAQEVLGNNADNVIRGGGGADALVGYGGDDLYWIEDGREQLFEAAGGGRDVVYAQVSYVLTEHAHVEVLSAVSLIASAAIDLTGNAINNQLLGNDGANVLNGGLGNDTLVGYAGADTFAFTTALGGNVDFVFDMASGVDKIAIDNAVFTGLANGALAAGAFRLGGGAGDADDRIIYDQASGAVYFDADGNGGGAAVQFAQLQAGATLTASDFMVI